MNMIKAIKRGIVFQFQEAINTKGEFEQGKSSGGIILQASFDDSAKQSRIVNVVAAGSDCEHIREDMAVLLPALRWTPASTLNGQKVWKSDETQVVAIITETDIKPISNYVIFTRNKPTVQKSNSGLLVVLGDLGDTANGTVVAVGEKTASELSKGCTIFFNDANFNDTFTHNNTEYAFIKDDEILAYR